MPMKKNMKFEWVGLCQASTTAKWNRWLSMAMTQNKIHDTMPSYVNGLVIQAVNGPHHRSHIAAEMWWALAPNLSWHWWVTSSHSNNLNPLKCRKSLECENPTPDCWLLYIAKNCWFWIRRGKLNAHSRFQLIAVFQFNEEEQNDDEHLRVTRITDKRDNDPKRQISWIRNMETV